MFDKTKVYDFVFVCICALELIPHKTSIEVAAYVAANTLIDKLYLIFKKMITSIRKKDKGIATNLKRKKPKKGKEKYINFI